MLQRVKTILGTSRSRMQQPIALVVAQGQGLVRICALVLPPVGIICNLH